MDKMDFRFSAAFFVFLSAPAWARLVSAYFIFPFLRILIRLRSETSPPFHLSYGVFHQPIGAKFSRPSQCSLLALIQGSSNVLGRNEERINQPVLETPHHI